MVSEFKCLNRLKKIKVKYYFLIIITNCTKKDWRRQDGTTGSSSAEVDLGCITFHRFNTIHAMLLWWFYKYTVAKNIRKQKNKSGSAHRNRADTWELHKIFLLLHSALLDQVEYVQLHARIKCERTIMRYCIYLRDQKLHKSWGKKFVSKCWSRMREDYLITRRTVAKWREIPVYQNWRADKRP